MKRAGFVSLKNDVKRKPSFKSDATTGKIAKKITKEKISNLVNYNIF